MNSPSEHAWIRPMGVISNVRRKRGRDEPDAGGHDGKEVQGLPGRKKPATGRQHSIFTLSSNNAQIAEEQCDIKGMLTSKVKPSESRIEEPAHDPEVPEVPDRANWHEQLCVDWSLKSFLRISTKIPFAWSSNNLKSSEESSGTSAFVRCVDSGTPLTLADDKPNIDTSLGAQFHQCCLYWQHPYIPSLTLFPRENKITSNYNYSLNFAGKIDGGYASNNSSSSSTYNSSRFDDKMLECMQTEWIEALRSSFHLMRLRQCPYFYVCSSVFTCLFCSAGIRDQEIRIYITPSTKGFRDSLKKEGIKFEMPYFNDEKSDSQNASPPQDVLTSKPKSKCDDSNEGDDMQADDKNEESDDEGPDKWLDDMGISQDVSISNFKPFQNESTTETKMKSTLIVIKGLEALPFFNFLINTRNMLIASSGPLAGIPPTILSPVAFHGASLRTLKVKQKKVKNDSGQYFHLIEMNGPILPYMPHLLCELLSKTVGEYKIHVNTLSSTIPLNNVNPDQGPYIPNNPNAFALQSLTDCGLTKSILEVFCQCVSNCCTIKEVFQRKHGLFNWN